MASSPPTNEEPLKTVAELVEYAKQELVEDARRQAGAQTVNNSDLTPQTSATLDISHLRLTALPVEVIQIIRHKVERLAISHNSNVYIPPQINQMERLRYLNLRWNGLRVFPPALLQLPQLEILDLSKNKIAVIPLEIKNMASLKFLAISKNKIMRLPMVLGDMNSLSRLRVHDNPIEFPPPKFFQTVEYREFCSESEKERELCEQLKRYLRQAALREAVRTTLDDDSNDTQQETPRPSRRIAPAGHQRFPVRPSISGFGVTSEPRTGSPDSIPAPLVPQKSQARNFSGQRMAGAPSQLTSGRSGEMTRSLSTASTSSRMSKRHGVVPEKGSSTLGSVSSMTSIHTLNTSIDRSSQITLKASRTPHSAFGNGFLFPNPTHEPPSEVASPIEPPKIGLLEPGRYLSTFRERAASSVPIDRNFPPAQRCAAIFNKLLKEALCIVQPGGFDGIHVSSKMNEAFSSNAQLERRVLRAREKLADSPERAKKVIRSLPACAESTAKAIVSLISSEKHATRRATETEDPFLCRIALLEMYTALNEARNVCVALGYRVRTLGYPNTRQIVPSTPRQTRGASSRTVTPSQPKPELPPNPRLKRAPTIIQNKSGRPGLPPPPVSINSSRSNTMTSSTSATPRSADPAVLPPLSVPTTQTRVRSKRVRGDSESEHFAHVWLKLDVATRMANDCLRNCHSELTVRLDNATSTGQHTVAKTYSLTLMDCNRCLAATSGLTKKLKEVKERASGSRNPREFWMMCDNFVHVGVLIRFPLDSQLTWKKALGRPGHLGQEHGRCSLRWDTARYESSKALHARVSAKHERGLPHHLQQLPLQCFQPCSVHN
ncbi:hypothetical protein K431DRAFT_110078 [Polychaeton citri CBS 116435]|uniref:Disease resistance R13L4/SHOC-2-like LRR domain-containing protein n=1 Tax=Polychaeton citri CBS 116435 TaxID=1314669 RepID=A0A9P4Q7C8_9PEZI|nr:hypothetical protein K431DRAFT_110078 [Polychaeton citri CBS 116435]